MSLQPDRPLRDLTPAELRAFQDDGVVVAEGLFPEQLITSVNIICHGSIILCSLLISKLFII